MLQKRIQKKKTSLFFDSFKHFKNNATNLVFTELITLIKCSDLKEYASLKSVNYKSKLPDMKKLGLINYLKPADNQFELTEHGKIIYAIIKNIGVDYYSEEIKDKRRPSYNPIDMYYKIIEKKSISDSEKLVKTLSEALIEYYDSADSIRPYLLLLKLIEHHKIETLDYELLTNILAQKKVDVLNKKIVPEAYASLEEDIKSELKRPISYMYNFLQTCKIIDENKKTIYDKKMTKDIIFNLNEIHYDSINDTQKSYVTRRPQISQCNFRNEVMEAYEFKCAITGKGIKVRDENNTKFFLEAAHIIPYSDSGSFSVSNGIALSYDMHKLFDNNLFAFEYDKEDNLIVVVTKSEKVDDDGTLAEIDGKKVFLPAKKILHPDIEAIKFRKQAYFLS